MNNHIQVSICCTTYNHEKYIRQCLDGFIMQKNVDFEIIIHDDASTDNTVNIIKEYKKRYPKIIKPIYQIKNQYQQGVEIISTFIFPKIKGKYVALCEGDDCWIDENKLKIQVDYMDNHEKCSMTCHNSIRNEVISGKKFIENPFDKEGIVTLKDIIYEKNGTYIATSSLVIKSSIFTNRQKFYYDAPIGDLPLRIHCCTQGYIYYFSKPMTIYNFQTESSWTRKMMNNDQESINFSNGMIEFYRNFNVYTNYRYKKYINYAISKTYYRIIKLNNSYIKNITSEYFIKYMSIKEKICTLFPTLYIFYKYIKLKMVHSNFKRPPGLG